MSAAGQWLGRVGAVAADEVAVVAAKCLGVGMGEAGAPDGGGPAGGGVTVRDRACFPPANAHRDYHMS